MSINIIIILGSLFFGLVTLVVGFCGGLWFAVAPKTTPANAKEDDGVQHRTHTAASAVLRLIQTLAGDVQAHSNKVASISAELKDVDSSLPEACQLFTTFPDRLLEANLALQQQLTRAKQYIEFQTVQMRAREAEARTDLLTSLLNRRAFDEELARQFSHWDRNETSCVILLLDIDYFKRFNDLYGHQIGDFVLQAVGHAIVGELRGMDTAYRYGGEEFAVILPSTFGSDAWFVAERIRAAIASAHVSGVNQPLSVTTSIGIANVLATDEPSRMVARADEALYRAKQAGRNCVRWHNGREVQRLDAERTAPTSQEPFSPEPKSSLQVSIADFNRHLTRHVCDSRRENTPLSIACVRVVPLPNVGDPAIKKSQEKTLSFIIESAKRKLLPTDLFVVINATELVIVLPEREQAEATRVINEVLADLELKTLNTACPHYEICELSPLESAEELFVRARQESLALSGR